MADVVMTIPTAFLCRKITQKLHEEGGVGDHGLN